MTVPALGLNSMRTTGSRAAAAGRRVGVRYIRTSRGIALFDEGARFVGLVEAPSGVPQFGPAGETVLLRRGV